MEEKTETDVYNLSVTDLEPAAFEREPVELKEIICKLSATLIELHQKLLNEFSQDGVDLQAFYQKNFKDDKLLDNILPLYVQMHSVAYRTNQKEITFAQKVTARGYASEIEAYRTLQSLEEKWNRLIFEIDEAMDIEWKSHEKEYVDSLDIGAIGLIDCEKMKKVFLRDILNKKCGHYTLFVLLRFYG